MLWVFSVCTTLLLIGLWGRSVASDHVTLEASTRAVLESELIHERIESWISEALVTAAEVGGAEAADLTARLQASTEMQDVIALFVDEAVTTALAPPGTSPTIDVAEILEPAIPLLADEFSAAGLEGGVRRIQDTLDDLAPLVVDPEATASPSSIARSAVSLASTVVVIALIGMVVTGGLALLLAERPLQQLRALAMRISLSALTFAVILRLGSWAVDPAGGRSPIAAGSSVVLRSNWGILAFVAGGGLLLAALAIAWQRTRRGAVNRDGHREMRRTENTDSASDDEKRQLETASS